MGIWKRQKSQAEWQPPTKKVRYPKWTIVRTEKEESWLILDTTKMLFISDRACFSWGKQPVTSTSEATSGYLVWKKVGFAPGTLLRSMSGQYWFITGAKPTETERRLITTPDFFTVLGFNPNNAIVVSEEELLFHQEGDPINDI